MNKIKPEFVVYNIGRGPYFNEVQRLFAALEQGGKIVSVNSREDGIYYIIKVPSKKKGTSK